MYTDSGTNLATVQSALCATAQNNLVANERLSFDDVKLGRWYATLNVQICECAKVRNRGFPSSRRPKRVWKQSDSYLIVI
jgi:hypothetical protein